jgi:hypothetical protein
MLATFISISSSCQHRQNIVLFPINLRCWTFQDVCCGNSVRIKTTLRIWSSYKYSQLEYKQWFYVYLCLVFGCLPRLVFRRRRPAFLVNNLPAKWKNQVLILSFNHQVATIVIVLNNSRRHYSLWTWYVQI